MMDVEAIRRDFPILNQRVNDEPLIYLDNAATTQKPSQVIDALTHYYLHDNANVYRGVHTLSHRATEAYEAVRAQVAQFIQAATPQEIIFTRGTTSSLNGLAYSLTTHLQPGDEIVLTPMEHHSNLIPWQQLAQRTGASLVYLPLTDQGEIDLEAAAQMIRPQTKVVTVAHVSNVMGCIHPIRPLADLVHAQGGWMIVDGAQGVPHQRVNVSALDCDFYAFSSHKMLGPTGVGVLYGRQALLDVLEPFEYGGEMNAYVDRETSQWKLAPYKFEAGTPPIAGVIGLGAAITYLEQIGMDAIHAYEQELTRYVMEAFATMEGVTLYGPTDPARHTGVIAYNLEGIHPHDVATAYDLEGIAVRAGHHCAQPLMQALGVPATLRASFYLYNTRAEAERFIQVTQQIKEYFNYGA